MEIINTSTPNSEDIKFVNKDYWRKPSRLAFIIICFILVILSLSFALVLFMEHDNFYRFFLILGIVLFLTSLLSCVKTKSQLKRKNNIIKKREIIFKENEIFVSTYANTKIEQTCDYSHFERAVITKSSIILISQNKASYLPIHDNEYKKGTKQELIKLLKSKNLKIIEK